MGRADGGHGDAVVAQPELGEELDDAVDQQLVGAAIDGERVDVRRGLGVEVAVQVRAAERVDGLLGVPDEDRRAVRPEERPLHDGPLVRIRVLELVDEDGPEAALQGVPDRLARRRGLQDAQEAGDDVVVGADALRALAVGIQLAHLPGELVVRPRRREQVERRERGLHPDAQRGARRDGRLPVHAVQLEVGVGGALMGQVDRVRPDDLSRVPVAEDAELVEHRLAERVGREDGHLVEPGDGLGQPCAVQVRVGPGEVGGHPVLGVWQRLAGQRGVKGSHGPGQAFEDPGAQLSGGVPAEGDEQEVADVESVLREVAGGQRCDGVGLAGPGARLQEGGGARQGAGQVEGGHAPLLTNGA